MSWPARTAHAVRTKTSKSPMRCRRKAVRFTTSTPNSTRTTASPYSRRRSHGDSQTVAGGNVAALAVLALAATDMDFPCIGSDLAFLRASLVHSEAVRQGDRTPRFVAQVLI